MPFRLLIFCLWLFSPPSGNLREGYLVSPCHLECLSDEPECVANFINLFEFHKPFQSLISCPSVWGEKHYYKCCVEFRFFLLSAQILVRKTWDALKSFSVFLQVFTLSHPCLFALFVLRFHQLFIPHWIFNFCYHGSQGFIYFLHSPLFLDCLICLSLCFLFILVFSFMVKAMVQWLSLVSRPFPWTGLSCMNRKPFSLGRTASRWDNLMEPECDSWKICCSLLIGQLAFPERCPQFPDWGVSPWPAF